MNIYLLTYSRLQLLLIHNEPRSWQAAILYQRRGGWSYYYMHGAAPITQYMAASTQFNPLSQQIIIYVRAKPVRADVIRNVRSIIINNVTNLLCYQRMLVNGGVSRISGKGVLKVALQRKQEIAYSSNKLEECRTLWGEPSRAVSTCD